jgi:tetratricopeptide (TPR) repeat protein
MSIIAETLDRLEGESHGLRDPLAGLHKGGIGPRRRAAGRGRFPLKSVAAVLLLGGAGVAAWYWDASPVGTAGPSLAEYANPVQAERPSTAAVATPGDATAAPAEAQALPAEDKAPAEAEPAALRPAAATTASSGQAPPSVVLATSKPAGLPSEEALAVIGIAAAGVEGEPEKVAGKASLSSEPRPAAALVARETAADQAVTAQEPLAPVEQQVASPAAPAKPSVPAKSEAPALVAEQPVKSVPKKPVKATPQPVAKAAAVASAEPATAKPRPAQTKAAPVGSRKAQKVQPTVAQQASDTLDAALEQARIALSRGQYPQALDALQAVAPVPGKRADFWLLKGSSHLGLGQLDLAEEGFTKAQPLAPGNAQIAIQLAILKQEKNDHEGALKILAEAAARHPNMPEIYLNQGYSQLELGATRDAGHSFRIFLRLTEGRSLYAEQRKAVNRWLAQTASISG